ncbi:unannotated protein [freshwater metagenome]|uniref:Unannotated protein n=1 Tax=freshwater metagenome TaxID=449393 RepID=A0A6J7J0V9_9ZZZZ
MDRVALDVHPEDGLGLGLRVFRRVGEFHSTGLAAPTDLHLRLHDDGRADLACGLVRRSTCRADLARSDWNVVLAEEVLGLVLVQVHA